MKITLPAQLNPISRRKDKSIKLSFETRELSAQETMTLMSLEGEEMWILLSTNNDIKEEEIPEENAELESKPQSKRIRDVLYILYLQETKKQKFIGSWESFYKEKTERYITQLKSLIEE